MHASYIGGGCGGCGCGGHAAVTTAASRVQPGSQAAAAKPGACMPSRGQLRHRRPSCANALVTLRVRGASQGRPEPRFSSSTRRCQQQPARAPLSPSIRPWASLARKPASTAQAQPGPEFATIATLSSLASSEGRSCHRSFASGARSGEAPSQAVCITMHDLEKDILQLVLLTMSVASVLSSKPSVQTKCY